LTSDYAHLVGDEALTRIKAQFSLILCYMDRPSGMQLSSTDTQ